MLPHDFITLERIECCIEAAEIGSKTRLLWRLGELLAAGRPGLPPNTIFDRLLEREKLGTTGFGEGIALPHARVASLKQALGAFVQLQQGVDFYALDGCPVDLAFALLVPLDATEEHLQLLKQLATMFGQQAFCERLRQAQSAEQLLEILTSDAPFATVAS